MIELQVNEIQLPAEISFNYEEIKRELAETLTRYEGLVYSPDQMKAAKADKAALNKLRKALNDERIRREREYMAPFMDFKAKIADLISAIDRPVSLIDKQVKEYEEQKKLEKRKQIEEYFETMCDFPEWLKLDQIFVQSWLNASCSMKTVEGDLKAMQEMICKELAALAEMPAFSFEATEVYKQTLNLTAAINEGKRLADIQARKAEQERLKAEQERLRKETEAARIAAENERRIAAEVTEEVAKISAEAAAAQLEVSGNDLPNPYSGEVTEQKQWINFRALLTVPQAKELRAFFEQRGIEFKAV